RDQSAGDCLAVLRRCTAGLICDIDDGADARARS
ncbi:MAG: hypothetical protein ACI9U2_005192, partial [Bradymonadia bacterium]